MDYRVGVGLMLSASSIKGRGNNVGTSEGFEAKRRQLKHLNRYRTHTDVDLHNLVGGR